MCSVISHYRNANQNYNEIPLTVVRTCRKWNTLLGEMENGCSCFGKAWWFLRKLKQRITICLKILPQGAYPRELKTYVHTNTCKWMVTASLFIIAKKWNGLFFAHKKNGVLIHATTCMNCKNMLSETSKTKGHILWFHLHKISRIGKTIQTSID